MEKKMEMETLSGRVPAGLPDAFKKTVPTGYKIGHCLAAAARLWIDLPEQTRLQLLTGTIQNPLVEIVRQIVEERIAEGKATAQTLLEPPRQKRDRKG